MFDISDIPEGRLARMKTGVTVKLYADHMYLRPHLYGEYEVHITKLMCALVRQGDTSLDVGANFGYYTALLSMLAGSAGTVHSFEPLPAFYRMSTETVLLNNASSIAKVHNIGLGATSGTFNIYTFTGLPQGHASSNNLGRSDATPHVCFVTTLDEFVAANTIKAVDFVKVDVEGDELSVFRGGERVLSAPNAPAITFEINQDCLASRSLAATEVYAALRDYGYSFFYCIPYRGRIRQVAELASTSHDYLALKANRVPYFRSKCRIGADEHKNLVHAVPGRQ
jgi:FkbM family methyltransferase